MGKIRVKQIGDGFEEVTKPKKKKEEKEVLPEKKEDRRFVKDKKPTFPGSVHGRSARYKKIKKGIINEAVVVKDAVEKVKQSATAKFIEAIELHLNVEKIGIRVQVRLPHPLSSKKKVLYITLDGAKAKKIAGKPDNVELVIKGEEAIEEINSAGNAPGVDQIWAEAGVMPKLAAIAKIIGPAGLMPNPKHGTLISPEEIGKKLKSLSEGNITLSTEKKAAIIHAVIGKADMTKSKLTANIDAVIKAVNVKNIKSAYISSTMGPSVQLSLL